VKFVAVGAKFENKSEREVTSKDGRCFATKIAEFCLKDF
jgi:hypothetical protein